MSRLFNFVKARAQALRPWVALLATALPGSQMQGAERLLVFAGAATKPPLEEVARQYAAQTGIRVELVFGASGQVLSQMRLTRQGDLYLPGSSDFMEKAKRQGDVYSESEQAIAYLVPAINVPKGNPHRIRTLHDLTRAGLRIAIANPEAACVGAYAVEIIERHLSPQEKTALRQNLVTYTESCEKTATILALKLVDAVLGWNVFEHWDPKRIETVPLPSAHIVRIGYIPVAVSRFSRNREAAQAFLDFLLGPEGRAVFARHGYFTSREDAFKWIGEIKPVGGEYSVPSCWISR
ncbi:MAG: molybdate ABC transporter substrate-binding protein [Verrucomicrobiota bacterium]|nr:molybdate ABC transporter substrate-binding protein [Limisphaera sp.]MDW8380613.1 molybdate ABC transporter substrate-binding protein [Verrucomicrobiota bacterium]